MFRALRQTHFVPWCHGWLAGIYLVTWLHFYFANFGATKPASTALMVLAGGIFWLATRNRGSSRIRATGSHHGIFHFAMAAWTVGLIWWVGDIWKIIAALPSSWITSSAFEFGVFFLVASVTLGAPLYFLMRIVVRDPRIESNDLSSEVSRLNWIAKVSIGMAFGILVHVHLVAPWLGVDVGGLSAAGMSCGVFFWNAFIGPKFFSRASSEGGDPVSVATEIRRESESAQTSLHGVLVATLVVAVCLGCCLAGTTRYVNQLFSAASWFVYSELAFLLIGVGFGLFQWSRPKSKESRPPNVLRNCWASLRVPFLRWTGGLEKSSTSHPQRTEQIHTERDPVLSTGLSTAFWCILAIAIFPLFVRSGLWAMNNVANVNLMMLYRSAVAALMWIPFGFAVGRLARWQSLAVSRLGWLQVNVLGASAMGLVLGWGFGNSVLIPTVGVAYSLIITAWLLCSFGLIWAWRKKRLPSGRWQRRLTVVATILVLASPLWSRNYAPSLSARVLFDSTMSAAAGQGVELSMLPYLDDQRLVSVVEGDHGTYTVWKRRGQQVQIRESGVPKGVISVDPEICPRFSTTVLEVVLPLTLHEHPRRALLLGLGSGVQLETCLSFPIEEVTCVEADSGLIHINRNLIDRRANLDPFRDERVRLIQSSPELAVATLGSDFDVVVSQLDHPALLRSSSAMTSEHYRRIAGCMAEDGIFCQRFHYMDFGAEPIRSIGKTLQSVFRHVAIVESAPGDLLFVATNSARGLARPQLLTRLQRPHVRLVLSQLGWDWSTMLNLPTCGDSLGSLWQTQDSSEPDPVVINAANNGHLAFQLPRLVLRWSPKMVEVRTMMAGRAIRFQSWLGEDKDSPDVKQRLTEVAKQHGLMIDYPDQYWVYRKTLKQQVIKHPRTEIVYAKHESPRRKRQIEDQRRLDYIKALGQLAQKGEPTDDDIRRVANYIVPYDPLVSYFAHEELAEIAHQSTLIDVRTELRLRLHTVYFASPSTRSIRCLTHALRLVSEEPDTVTSDEQRWDTINGLLELLEARWNLRSSSNSDSTQIVLNDIEHSLASIDAAMAVMDDLSSSIDVENMWKKRRHVLEKHLIRPLRSYRSKMLTHHLKNRD